MRIIKQDLKTGEHSNPRNVPEYFTTSFFHHPKELEEEIDQAGFKAVRGLRAYRFRLALVQTPTILDNSLAEEEAVIDSQTTRVGAFNDGGQRSSTRNRKKVNG